MSTVEYRDQGSSRRWQYDSALDVIAGHGVVVVEYFNSLNFLRVLRRHGVRLWLPECEGPVDVADPTNPDRPIAGFMRQDLAPSASDRLAKPLWPAPRGRLEACGLLTVPR